LSSYAKRNSRDAVERIGGNRTSLARSVRPLYYYYYSKVVNGHATWSPRFSYFRGRTAPPTVWHFIYFSVLPARARPGKKSPTPSGLRVRSPGALRSFFPSEEGLQKFTPTHLGELKTSPQTACLYLSSFARKKIGKVLCGSRFRDDLHAAPRLGGSRHRSRSTDELPFYGIPEYRDPTPKNLGVIRR
jgi:hypothetical protein